MILFITGYATGMMLTFLLLYFGHCLYVSRKPSTDTLSKKRILRFMSNRIQSLQDHIDRDFGGGLTDRLAKLQELKFLKGAIEREMFDDEVEVEQHDQ
jgi:hypothetical protein